MLTPRRGPRPAVRGGAGRSTQTSCTSPWLVKTERHPGHAGSGGRPEAGVAHGPAGCEGAPDVLVVDSANLDVVLDVREIPRPGETVLARGRTTGPGGKGANQAATAARSGARTLFVNAVGNDAAGECCAPSWPLPAWACGPRRPRPARPRRVAACPGPTGDRDLGRSARRHRDAAAAGPGSASPRCCPHCAPLNATTRGARAALRAPPWLFLPLCAQRTCSP